MSTHSEGGMGERMEAGRELDALVAERVMGHVDAHAPIYDGLTRTDTFEAASLAEANEKIRAHYPKSLAEGKLWPAQYAGPEYSSDIAAAWEVVERLAAKGFDVDIEKDINGEWFAHFCNGDSNAPDRCVIGHADADTAPHAICLAALKAAHTSPDSENDPSRAPQSGGRR